MVLYTLFSLSLLLLLLFNRGLKERTYIALSLFIVVIYWGASYINVPDMPGYQSVYASMNPQGKPDTSVSTHFEEGFLYLMWLFKKLGADFYLFQLVLFAIESTLVAFGIKKIGYDYRDLGSIVCLLGFWLPVVLMGALRQGLVIAIFVYSLHTLLNQKYHIYILLIAISCLFHKSAVFLLLAPLWFLFTNMFINRKVVLLIIFVLVNVLHFSGVSLLSPINDFLSYFFSDVADQDMTVYDYNIYSDSTVGGSNFGILKLLEVDFCYIMALLIHPEKDDKGVHYLASLFLIFFVLNMLVGGIIIHRITYYLQIPYFLLLFKAFMSFFSDLKIKKQGQYVLTFLYILITTIILSKPYSFSAIHEYHLFDALGL